MKIIILAGGVGRRLWPVSQREKPKQFLDIFGTGETLVQTAANRAIRLVGKDNVFVVTNAMYSDLIHEQLPWLKDYQLFLEPIHRNTCPAAAWATHRVLFNINKEEENSKEVIAFMPADQLIIHEDRFESALRLGADFVVSHDTVLTMGATPTRTEPGYGYIQIAHSDNADANDEFSLVHNVKSFVEKPEREFAKILIESGEFLWNTGIYMARAEYICEQFKNVLPYVLRDVRCSPEEENDFIRENYSRYPNLSLDLAILEKMPERSVMHCDFGWADIGTWHGIYEAVPKDGEDNVIVNQLSRVITENSHRNVICLKDNRLAVLSGMEGFIVAENNDVLLICPKGDSSALVRKYLTQVENL